jgi:hypothetical protein
MHVWIASHPALKEYIRALVVSMRTWLLAGTLKQVVFIVKKQATSQQEDRVQERFIFDIDVLQGHLDDVLTAESVRIYEQQFKRFLGKIANSHSLMSDYKLQQQQQPQQSNYDPSLSWTVLLHTTKDAVDDPTSDNSVPSWLTAEAHTPVDIPRLHKRLYEFVSIDSRDSGSLSLRLSAERYQI